MELNEMRPSWSILYRGRLSGCNYVCNYCPFAKTVDSREVLAGDAADLGRFVDWVAARSEEIGVLFTPWGEGLIRRHYREGMRELSWMPQVRRVAIQTNLSADLAWLAKVNLEKVALWVTYHPSQVSRTRFLGQCARLDGLGVAYSVGMVGMREDIPEIEAMRAALPAGIYMWVNAYKRERPYYSGAERARLRAVDPYFPMNNVRHPSLGKSCRAGESVFSVNGAGEMFRCHFIKQGIGNIYAPGFEAALRERPCSMADCGCHIGYVHLDDLGLYDVFGNGILERIPEFWGV